MTKESFYLTLLSNSSMEYFPENMTTRFSTKLPKSIVLEGTWDVGIVEFQYPCTMFTVQEHESMVYVTKLIQMPNEATTSTVYYKKHIPATNYDNINHILMALNNIRENIKFRYDELSKYVHVAVMDENIKSLSLSTQLSLQLGFEPHRNLVEKGLGKCPANLHLGLPPQLFVYCDIIEPQIVGDVMTPLLRIIPLDPSKYIYGANKMHVFSPPHYLPVMRREFDTIEIDIRTSTGQKIPFQFGTVCIKLHFRKL